MCVWGVCAYKIYTSWLGALLFLLLHFDFFLPVFKATEKARSVFSSQNSMILNHFGGGKYR